MWNYLLGRENRPFDILYWNADATNMPAEMHTFFMRNMYLENRLREPGGITLAGVPIDVTSVTTPAYVLSGSQDHIAPWKTTYATTQLLAGPVRFVLSGSGHIAAWSTRRPTRSTATGPTSRCPPNADEWLAACAIVGA